MRLLVVEDEPAVQELVRYTLQQAGMKAVTVASAEEAMTALNEELPDVALIDWMLPAKSGLQLTRELREAPRPHLRVEVRPPMGDRPGLARCNGRLPRRPGHVAVRPLDGHEQREVIQPGCVG